MSDPVRIALIVAAVVVIVLIILRRQLRSFLLKANKDGIEAEIKTHAQAAASGCGSSAARRSKPASVNIKGSSQWGLGNRIKIKRDDVTIEQTTQSGVNQEIIVESEQPSRKKK